MVLVSMGNQFQSWIFQGNASFCSQRLWIVLVVFLRFLIARKYGVCIVHESDTCSSLTSIGKKYYF